MKRDFFEIMKNYNPVKESGVTLSPDRIKEKAFEKIKVSPEKRKVHLSGKFAVLAAAAVVSVTASLTVLACEFGVFDKAVSFFENKNTAATVNLNETDKNVIGANLMENTVVVQSEGTTIRLTGSMYDENTAYFFFELTAPEDTILSDEEYTFKENMLCYDKDIYGGAGWEIVFDDNDRTDNITYFTLKMNCNGFSVQDFYELNLSDFSVHSCGSEYEKVILSGQWAIPLETGTPVTAIELCEDPATIYLKDKSAVISSLKLSPLGITVISSNELFAENSDIDAMNPLSDKSEDELKTFVKMKDGSLYYNINMGAGGRVEEHERNIEVYYFDKPINIDNVESVIIGDTEFKVK